MQRTGPLRESVPDEVRQQRMDVERGIGGSGHSHPLSSFTIQHPTPSNTIAGAAIRCDCFYPTPSTVIFPSTLHGVPPPALLPFL